MQKRKKYDSKYKSKIILEVLKEEKTINEIAAREGLHPNLISRWKSEFLEGMEKIFEKENIEAEKLKKVHEEEIEELYKQLGKQAAQIEWLKKKICKILLVIRKEK